MPAALVIVDVQNDFMPPNGSLAVKDGLSIIPVINALKKSKFFDLVVCTIDWHPKDHMSFYSNNRHNPKAKLLQPLELPNGEHQVMWPDHCVQNTKGADLHPKLEVVKTDLIVKKGENSKVDSYSGFFDNDHKTQTELHPLLQKHGITHVYCVGVAYDYCVGYTALDAVQLGYHTFLIEDAARPVDQESLESMLGRLKKAGVHVIKSTDLRLKKLEQKGAL